MLQAMQTHLLWRAWEPPSRHQHVADHKTVCAGPKLFSAGSETECEGSGRTRESEDLLVQLHPDLLGDLGLHVLGRLVALTP